MKITKKLNDNFTIVDNNIMKEKDLSLRAKGLYLIIIGLSEDWNFSVKGLSQLSKESYDATNTAIKELEQFNYIERKKYNTSKGWKTEYIIYDSYTMKNPSRENPSRENPRIYKENNNKENNNKENKDILATEVAKAEKPKNQINEAIEILKPLNEIAYTKWFANKTQRQNVELLLKKFTLEKLQQLVDFIIQYKHQEYFPTITTPYQLVDKLPAIQRFIKSNGYAKKRPTVIF